MKIVDVTRVSIKLAMDGAIESVDRRIHLKLRHRQLPIACWAEANGWADNAIALVLPSPNKPEE